MEWDESNSANASVSISAAVTAPKFGTNRMKVKTRHKKSSSWKRKANSSPIAKGRRAKRKGRNPGKMKHIGGRGL